MADQVESLDVGFQDGVSAGAKSATNSLKGLGDAATTAEAKTERAGRGMKKATDEVAAGAAAAKKAIGEFAGEVERSNEPVKRSSQTIDQLSNKFDRAKREAGAVARAIAPYQKALDDLEKSTASAAEKEELRATITAKMEAATEKARAATARYFKDVEAGAAAASASVGGMSAGMAAMTASANSWAGALGKVYETAGSMSGGLNQAARALRDLNAGLASGHTSFAEWTAGAKGLEASLRGVSAAQKAINDSTGVSRQNVNTATIGTLKYDVTGNAAPTGNTLGLVTGDADASVKRLGDLTAAFAEADAALDGYRERLGLVDVAQRKFEAGQEELRQAIRLAGVEGAEAAKLMDAYAAANDPALKKKVADWDAAARERDADAQMILADEKALAAAAAKTTAENAKLAASYDQVMGAVDPAIAAEQRYQKALGDLRAGAAAAGKSMDQLAADEARLTASMSPAAIAAKKEEDALRSLIGGLDRSFFAAATLTKQQALLDRAMTEGIGGVRLSAEQHAALSKVMKDQYDVTTRGAAGTKLAAHEMTNLTYQIQDTFVSLAGGQNPLLVLMQQGPQATSAVGGVGRAMALLVSPITLAVLGAAAFVGGLAAIGARAIQIGAQTRELTGTMRAYGTEAQATAQQLRGVATALYEGGAGRDESFATAKLLASTRGLSGTMGREIALLGSDMAAGLGGSVDEMTKQLAGLATEGYPAIMKLQEATGFLNAEELVAVRTMSEHGRQADALGVALGALHRRFDGLRKEGLTPAGEAMRDLGVQFNRMLDAATSSSITIAVTVAVSEQFKALAGFIENPSLGGIGKVLGANPVLRYSPGGLLANALFGPDDEASLQKKIGDAKTRLAELETNGATDPAIARPEINRAQDDIAALERRLAAITKGIAAATKAPTTLSGPTLRAANDLPTDSSAFLAQQQKATDYVNEQQHALDRLSKSMQGNAVDRALAAAAMRAEDEIRDKHLEGGKAEEIQTLRRKEALLQLVVAVNDNNRAAAADIAGNDLVARAYGVSTAAVREASIHQKALAEAARGTIEPYDAIVARLRAVDDATRKVQAAQFDATLKQQTDDANRLADAWGKGANAAREAALANEVLAEARKRGLDPTRDSGEIGDIGSGVLARDQAQRAQQFAQMAAEQRRSVELTNAEYDMLGQSNAERAKTVAILQASNDLRDKGADLTDAGTKAYIAQAGEIAKVKSVLQEAGQTAANITQPITSGLEDVIVGAKGAGDAVKALGEDLKRIAARQLITKPFETAVSGLLTKAMTGDVSLANDNRPTPANDPGGLDRLITTVKGGLGSSSSNPMWVTMSSGSAAFDLGAMASGSPMPVAIKDAGNLEGIIQGAAAKYGVDPNIIKGIIQQESSWSVNAVNKTSGAAGLMQIMPANLRAYGVTDAFDPAQNIDAGTRILKEHLVRAGGDMDKALSTYSGHVKTSGAVYVSAVNASADGYRQAGNGLRLVVDNTQGVTAAQENQLQALLDAVPVQRAASDSAQSLTTAQRSLVDLALGITTAQRAAMDATAGVTLAQRPLADSALGIAGAQRAAAAASNGMAAANDNASTIIDIQSRSISSLGANAISVASQMDEASDGAKGLAKASEDSSGILLSGARAVYNGFSSVLSSLWNTVSGLFVGGGAPAATATGAVGGTAQSGGIFGQVGQLASAGQSAYTAFTGGYASMGTSAGTWLANSQLGVSMGWSVPQSVVGATGPQLPFALTSSGEAMVGTLGQIGAGLPFGAVGGIGGGLIGTAANSKTIGGLSGAALGAGSALGYEAIMGAGAAGGPWGIAAATVVAAVMSVLGTQKKSVGPNGAANLYVDSTGAKSGPADGDNGMDGDALKAITDATATSVNTIVASIGSTFKKGLGEQNLAHLTYFQEGNKWALQSMAGGATVGDKQSFDTQEELVQALIRQTLQRLDQGGQVSPFSADVRTALTNSKATKAEDLAGDITFASGFRDQLTLMQASLDPVNNQIKTFTENAKKIGENVKSAIMDWHDKALELGLATEGELVPALKAGVLAMMGLGPTVQPLIGMAAVTKQATIEFEQYKPALESLGYSAAEVTDLGLQYVAKAQKAYQDAAAYTKRQGAVAIEALADPTVKATASDRLQGLGLDPQSGAVAGLAAVIGGVEAAAKAGTLTLADERWALGRLDAQLDAGTLTAEQYTTAVGYLTQAWEDSTTAAQKAATGRRATEDLTVRAIRATGDTAGADAYAQSLADQRELAQAAADGMDAAYIAGLRWVQGIEATARATEAATKAQQTREDLTVRALTAQGRTTEADDYRRGIEQSREVAQAVKDGWSAADIAALKYCQVLENVAVATDRATQAQQAREDLTVRALTAMGRTDEADDYRRGIEQSREVAQAVKDGWSTADLITLKYVQTLEDSAVATERATKAAEKAAATNNARGDIFTRAAAASGNSVWAATLRFDSDAAQQRQTAWNNGLRGQDLTNLDTVLAAERAQAVFQAAQSAYLAGLDQEIGAKQTYIQSLQDGAVKIAQAARQFRQAFDSVSISEDAPISPQERLATAKAQWDAALTTVRSGTTNDADMEAARAALLQLGPTLVSIEKTNSAGTADTLFKEVKSVFASLGDVSALGVGTAEADLKVAQDSLKVLQQTRADAAALGQKTLGGLDSLNTTMQAAYADLPAAMKGVLALTGQPPANANGGGVVAPDKGGSSGEQAAAGRAWMADWFQRYNSLLSQQASGAVTDAQVQQQGQSLYTEKVNQANALPLDGAVWGAVIAMAASATNGAGTADWLRQVAHDKGVPGFAVGTLATPPGAVWVGERGPELMWQDGGAAVASSADSLRIAGLYATAANDRWTATNVSSFQPPAPARPVSSDNTAAIVAELRRLNAQIVELKKGQHDEEGAAQNQRGVLLTRLIKAVESLKAELDNLKPARVA